MDSQQLLVGLTAINVMLVATTWTGSRASASRDDPKVLRAQSFELVDARGEVRLQLHLGEDGSGNLRIRDGNGKVRVKLGTSAAGSTGLLLMDQSVEPTLADGGQIRYQHHHGRGGRQEAGDYALGF